MSFRDNLQHVRATRNMTQEQLAMLLGVSRQSVSKWEAERAYPEMDKLLKLCDLFGCTLDELVSGDLTARPPDTASSMPHAKVPQDVTGYDQAMRTFARKLSIGVSIPILGLSLSMLLLGLEFVTEIDLWSYIGVVVLIGAGIGVAVILPALFEHRGFRKAHPFVEDFYTIDQKDRARSTMVTGLVVGIGLIMGGLAAVLLLQAVQWLASSVFLMLCGVGVFAIMYGCMLGSRCNLTAYNQKSLYDMNELQIDALDDEGLQARARRAKRERSVYKFVMCIATAVGLVLLFVPALGAGRWFWLSWVVGGVLCGAIAAFRSMRSGE